MFLLRNARLDDLDDLYDLVKNFFINLPRDENIIEQKIKSSIKSFNNQMKNFEDNYFLFVLEDLDFRKVVGSICDSLATWN